MTINKTGMPTIPSQSTIGRLMAGAAVALAAMTLLGGAAFARPVGTTGVRAGASERTEGEKFANNYGYGDTDRDPLAGRTPQELSTHRALAALARSHHTAVDNQRTEGEKFANNYGFGNVDSTVVDRGRMADAARWQAYADAQLRRPMDPSDALATGERTEGEKYANNYGFGDAGDTDGSKVASVAGDSPAAAPVEGLSWETMAITASLATLLMGSAVVIVRRRNLRSTI